MASANTIQYRTKNGRHDFTFQFLQRSSCIDVYCLQHPSLLGRDTDVHKTHKFSDGRICFVGGREPRTLGRAKELAAQWAEYLIEYRRTGIPQS